MSLFIYLQYKWMFSCQMRMYLGYIGVVWCGAWLVLMPDYLPAQSTTEVDTSGTASEAEIAAPLLTSKYHIIQVHQPPTAAGTQVAVSLGRYIVNFGTREGVQPGGIFKVTDGKTELGLVRVEQVWRDSSSIRLIRLYKKDNVAEPMPLQRGYYLLPKYVLLETVLFDRGKPDLNPPMQERLRFAARLILSFPDFPVLIGGHTDNTGSAAQNLKLSESRAAEIRTYLYEIQRVPEAQMHLKGYGQAQPVANNNTEAGYRLNRRVEIVLVDQLP